MKNVLGQFSPVLVMIVLGISAFAYLNCSTGQNNHILAHDLGKIGKVDVSELTPQELERFDTIINREVSPCGNEYSLAQTLLKPSLCPLSVHATDYVISLVKQDYNAEEISSKYVTRYASIKGHDIALNGSPVLGTKNPSISIVVFSDFQCPYCAKAAKKLEELVKMYPDDVAVVFKHFPLTEIHPEAMLGARAGFAALQQEKFWEMHDTLFSRVRAGISPDKLRVIADGLGLDPDQFEEDLSSDAAKVAIEADVKLGQTLGVNGTPKIFINGRILEGGLDFIDKRIKEEFLRHKFVKK